VIFTSEFFVSTILPHIAAARRAGDPDRLPVLHIGRASPHLARLGAQNLEENWITVSPRQPFSPDLVPSDFFLFGALKVQLNGRTIESPDELVEAIREIAGAIPRTALGRAFFE
jgi:hypothetical protein